MAKSNLILNKDWANVFLELSDDKAGQLIKAAFAVHEGNEVNINDPVLSAFFSMMEVFIKENKEKYDRKCEQNSKNRAKALTADDDNGRSLTTDNDRQRSGVNININKNINKKDIKHKYGQYNHVLLTDDQYNDLVKEFGQDDTLSAVKKVDEYCEEHGKSYKNYALVIRRWGIKAVKENRPAGKFANFPQRDDAKHKELVSMIIANQ